MGDNSANNVTIYQIDDYTTTLMRSSVIIPCWSSIIEQLVFNSIDAGASSIDISVDKISRRIEVRDNGVGISSDMLRYQLGNWAVSSGLSTSRYGCRGEALRSLAALTDLTITSRSHHSRNTYSKRFSSAGVKFTVAAVGLIQCGTVVEVSESFYTLPVRAKNIRVEQELLRVKQFLQRVALLHHKVAWSLSELRSGKSLLRLSAQPSVIERLSDIQAADMSPRLTVISTNGEGGSISGLISHPYQDYCYVNRNMQYMFINNHSLKISDSLICEIDGLYTAVMKRFNGVARTGVRTSKHSNNLNPSRADTHTHTESGQLTDLYKQVHPCFVLRLRCKTDSEEKIFMDHYMDCHSQHYQRLMRCTFNFLRTFYSQYHQEFGQIFESVWLERYGYLPHKTEVTAMKSVAEIDSDENQYSNSDTQGKYKMYQISSSKKKRDQGVILERLKSINIQAAVNLQMEVPLDETDFNKLFFQNEDRRASADSILSTSTQDTADCYSSPVSVQSNCALDSLAPSIKSFKRKFFSRNLSSSQSLLPDREGSGKSVIKVSVSRDDSLCRYYDEKLSGSQFSSQHWHDSNFSPDSKNTTFNEFNYGSPSSVFPDIFSQNSVEDSRTETLEEKISLRNDSLQSSFSRSDEDEEMMLGAAREQPHIHRKSEEVHDALNENMNLASPSAILVSNFEGYDCEGHSQRVTEENEEDWNSSTPDCVNTAGVSYENFVCITVTDDSVNQMLDRCAEHSAMHLCSNLAPDSISITRDDLLHAMAIGQSDAKFIFAHLPNNRVLVVDQHAADERNELESMYSNDCPCGSICMLCFNHNDLANLHYFTPAVQVSVDSMSKYLLDQREDIFYQWGFKFVVESDPLSNHVTLLSSPIIAGDHLTSGDFVEFLQWLHNNADVPSIMIRPPCVVRILASKACRSAIKFGDILTTDDCQKILNKLSLAHFPFICAHGRPTASMFKL